MGDRYVHYHDFDGGSIHGCIHVSKFIKLFKCVNFILHRLQYGEGNVSPFQYSCLENPTEEEVSGLQSMGLQNQTQLSD